MSIFENQEDHELDVSDVKLETLVGEDRKYKTPDDLAKAYANADAYIASTKATLTEREAEIKVLKDLLDKNSVEPQKKEEVPGSQKQDDPPAGDQLKNDKNKDLSALVAEELEKQNTQKTFADNVNSVSERLVNHFGNERDAKMAIDRKAKELNVSTEWLMDIAGRSPAAFYNTIGIDQKSLSTPNSSSDVNTAAFTSQSNRKNFKFYEEIRKSQPKVFYSAAVQREMFAAAREQGDKFYT